LTRVGLKQKQQLTETAINQVFNFTQLQRFRQNRDLTAFDKSKAIPGQAIVDSDSSDNESDSDDEYENKNQLNVVVSLSKL